MVATIKDFNPNTRAIWHKKYMDTMKANGGLNDDEAKVCLEASMPDFDYKDDPVDTAIEEMTYWID